MAIIRFGDSPFFRDPWTEFERMRRNLDMLTKGLRGEEYGSGTAATVYPPLNVSEDKDFIYVRAEIAGITAADIEISVEGETLTIKGERKPLIDDEKVSYHRRELEYGRFSRAITLPTRVKIDKIVAKIADGILTIAMPKAEEVKPRQIRVSIS